MMKSLIFVSLVMTTALVQAVPMQTSEYEGSYQVSAVCSPTPKDCGPMAEAITYMSIFDSLGMRGLIISISDSKVYAPIYTYAMAQVANNNTHIRGFSTEATPFTRVSEILLDVDLKTGKIKGSLQDALYPGVMEITATPVRRVAEYYYDGGPSRIITATEILGRYKGRIGSADCELIVTQYSGGEIVGVLNIGGEQNFAFRAGAYDQKNGILTMTAMTNIKMTDRKIVLALRNINGREILTGFMLTGNSKTPEAEFQKISN